MMSREPVRDGVDMSLSQGIQTRTTLSLSLPLLNRGAGPATVSLDVFYDDSLSVQIEFDLMYFVFEDAEIKLMAPSFGPMSGGTLVRVDISEPEGQESRPFFGLPSFFDALADPAGLKVSFGNSFFATQVDISKLAEGQIQVNLVTPSRAESRGL